MLCFFIPGWSDAERGRVAHSIFEIGVRLGIRFTIVSREDSIPSDARVVSYSLKNERPDQLPCAWGQPCGPVSIGGRAVWAAGHENGEPDVVRGVADLLWGGHEQGVERSALDSLGRIKARQHPLAKLSLLSKPLVEEAAAALGARLSQIAPEGVRVSAPWPSGTRRAIVLTHDVDGPRLQKPRILARYLAYGFLMGAPDGRASFLYGAATRFFGRPDPQWAFEQWRKLETAYGLRSTFFFYPGASPGGRDIRDPEYEPGTEPLASEIRALSAEGWEIAVHTGLRTHGPAAHRAGCEALRTISGGSTVAGARAHYWGRDWLKPEASWRDLDAAGFAFDAGLNPNTLGFRFGTSMPFIPSFVWRGGRCDGLVVMPTAIMDSYAARRTSPEPAQTLDDILADIESAGGVEHGFLMLDWHERVLANLGAWKGLMAPLLERLNSWRDDSTVCFLTAGEAAQRWREHAKRCYLSLEAFPVLS